MGIFAVLALSSWDAYSRPLSARKWLALCALSSLGVVELILVDRIYGGSVALVSPQTALEASPT